MKPCGPIGLPYKTYLGYGILVGLSSKINPISRNVTPVEGSKSINRSLKKLTPSFD